MYAYDVYTSTRGHVILQCLSFKLLNILSVFCEIQSTIALWELSYVPRQARRLIVII